MFLSGMQNKKILQWDARTGDIVQASLDSSAACHLFVTFTYFVGKYLLGL